MPTNAKTRAELLTQHQDRLARVEALYRVTADHLRRSDLRGMMAEERQRITAISFPDGLYRTEFTASEDRQATVKALDFFAEVVDGAAKGRFIAESLSFSWNGIAGGANKQKVAAYSAVLGVDGNLLDREEWLFRPFVAEVVDERIVSIRGDDGTAVYLPAAAEAPRELLWSSDAGWDFAPVTPRRAAA
jgi:hypothetical protein